LSGFPIWLNYLDANGTFELRQNDLLASFTRKDLRAFSACQYPSRSPEKLSAGKGSPFAKPDNGISLKAKSLAKGLNLLKALAYRRRL